MKVPGIGEVKGKTAGFAAAGAGVLVYLVYRRRSQQAATAASTDGTMDPNAIDPSTGIPYSEESTPGSDYAVDPSTGVPYVYESGNQGMTTGTSMQFQSNSDWLSAAEQAAENQLGASYSLATSALPKYLSQTNAGLQTDEYSLVSEVVALLGQPPTGGPYRLIQGAPVPQPSSTPPPSTTPAKTPQVATLVKGVSLAHYAQENYPTNTATHLATLEALNPGLNPNDTTHNTMMIRTS